MEIISSLFLPSVLFLLSSLCFILLFNNRRQSTTTTTTTTTVIKGYPIVGSLPHFLRNINRVLEWSTELLIASAPSSTITLAPFIITSDPKVIEYIAGTRFSNFPNPEEITGTYSDLFGRGVLTENGVDEWKLQRKMISYQFNPKYLRAFVMDTVQKEIDTKLVPLLTDACNTGQVIDLQDVVERFVFDNICNLVLGTNPDCVLARGGEGERMHQAFTEATRICENRGMKTPVSIWRLKRLINVGSERRLKECMAIVCEFVEKSVRSDGLQREDTVGGDFLSRFKNDESVSDELLRDMLITLLLAGRDTLASALTWFFWNLSSNPEATANIRRELKSIRGSLHNAAAETFCTADKLLEMNYLHAALSESMRLYPPVSLDPKKCLGDDTFPDGTRVKKGWIVMYNSYAMGRKEEIWGEDCHVFRPERWLDEEGVFRARNVFEYPVFHAGPKMCLGKEMAYMQMKALAASVLEGFEVEVVAERGEFELGVALRMRGGLPVKIKRRTTA